MFKVIEKFRLKDAGNFSSTEANGNNGAFQVRGLKIKGSLCCIISDGEGWEHVSVSRPDRCPTWDEMCFIKNLFWGEDDLVIQYHPVKGDYINCHPYCLHLWRKSGTNEFCERPPKIMVGP